MLLLAWLRCLPIQAQAEALLRAGNHHKMVLPAALVLALSTSAQNHVPTFKTETKSALIWDEAVSNSNASTIRDPLTANEIHKLSYGGLEVSSRMGYERESPTKAGKLLVYLTTIANNTNSDATITYGGAYVDGRIALPLLTLRVGERVNGHNKQVAWELSKMHCFSTGFASGEPFFSAQRSPKNVTIQPNASVTLSFVTKDPRTSSILCSVDGCHITGSVRYFITVNQRDFVFVWPGHSVLYCGE